MWIITVDGKPKGKERPRHYNGAVFTPSATREYEKKVRRAFTDKYPGITPTDKPVTITVEAVYPVPKSWNETTKQKAYQWEIVPLVKPDFDNIEKILCDALNGLAFYDDCQIVGNAMIKRYCHEGEKEHVTMTIQEDSFENHYQHKEAEKPARHLAGGETSEEL